MRGRTAAALGNGRQRAQKDAGPNVVQHRTEIGHGEDHGDEVRIEKEKSRRIVKAGRDANALGCRHQTVKMLSMTEGAIIKVKPQAMDTTAA